MHIQKPHWWNASDKYDGKNEKKNIIVKQKRLTHGDPQNEARKTTEVTRVCAFCSYRRYTCAHVYVVVIVDYSGVLLCCSLLMRCNILLSLLLLLLYFPLSNVIGLYQFVWCAFDTHTYAHKHQTHIHACHIIGILTSWNWRTMSHASIISHIRFYTQTHQRAITQDFNYDDNDNWNAMMRMTMILKR